MSHQMLVSQSPLLHKAGLLPGIAVISLGINALLSPSSSIYRIFGIPTKSLDTKITQDTAQIYAIRNISIGLSGLAASYFKEYKTLGAILLGGAVVAFSDGLLNERRIKGGKWKHWVLVPFLSCMGLAFLGVFDSK